MAEEIREAGGRAAVKIADVADPGAAAALIAAAVEAFGRLDILVNNAAVRREIDFAELDYREWREIVAIILDGAYLCSHAALPHLIASGSGAIVNIGGVSAFTGGAGRAHVVAAKAGLVGLTRALAHDLAPHGITVNCVVPGLIDTTRAAGRQPAHHATPAAARRASRQARGDRRARAVPVRSRSALHHRPDHSRQRRRVHGVGDTREGPVTDQSEGDQRRRGVHRTRAMAGVSARGGAAGQAMCDRRAGRDARGFDHASQRDSSRLHAPRGRTGGIDRLGATAVSRRRRLRRAAERHQRPRAGLRRHAAVDDARSHLRPADASDAFRRWPPRWRSASAPRVGTRNSSRRSSSGFEVECKIAEAIHPHHYKKGLPLLRHDRHVRRHGGRREAARPRCARRRRTRSRLRRAWLPASASTSAR